MLKLRPFGIITFFAPDRYQILRKTGDWVSIDFQSKIQNPPLTK
jgi:hypothetical protein